MSRASACLFGFLLLTVPALSQAQSGYFIWSGVCSSCQASTTANHLYDDGLHGDGASGDGVFGVDITVDKNAGRYTWVVGAGIDGRYPYCWCTSGMVGSDYVWTTGPGDVIHFTLDRRAKSEGWGPIPGIACDHCGTAGAQLQVEVDYNELYPGFASAYPAERMGSVWESVVTIPTAGTHVFVFSTLDRSVYFSDSYNKFCGGGCSPGEQRLPRVVTTAANSIVRFQFDEASGQMRGIVLAPVPTLHDSWGSVKILYR